MEKGWTFSFPQKNHVLKNLCTYRTAFNWRGTFFLVFSEIPQEPSYYGVSPHLQTTLHALNGRQ